MSSDQTRIDLLGGRAFLESTADGFRLGLGVPELTLTTEEALSLARSLSDAAATRVKAEEATDVESEDDEDRIRLPMQLVILDVERDPEIPAEDNNLAPTAQVCCWIKEQTRANAVHVAIGWVNDSDWIITNVAEQRLVDRSDFEGSELLAYYEQALTDDEVFLYVTSEEDTGGDDAGE